MRAARTLATAVPSYGGIQPSRMREPAVVGMPLVTITSLSAMGTPASGGSSLPAARSASTAAAVASASSRVDVEERVNGAVHSGDAVKAGLRRGHRGDLSSRHAVGKLLGGKPRECGAGGHASSPRI